MPTIKPNIPLLPNDANSRDNTNNLANDTTKLNLINYNKHNHRTTTLNTHEINNLQNRSRAGTSRRYATNDRHIRYAVEIAQRDSLTPLVERAVQVRAGDAQQRKYKHHSNNQHIIRRGTIAGADA